MPAENRVFATPGWVRRPFRTRRCRRRECPRRKKECREPKRLPLRTGSRRPTSAAKVVFRGAAGSVTGTRSSGGAGVGLGWGSGVSGNGPGHVGRSIPPLRDLSNRPGFMFRRTTATPATRRQDTTTEESLPASLCSQIGFPCTTTSLVTQNPNTALHQPQRPTSRQFPTAEVKCMTSGQVTDLLLHAFPSTVGVACHTQHHELITNHQETGPHNAFFFFFYWLSHAATQGAMNEFRRIAIGPDAIGRAIAFAVEQPSDVDVSEVIVRPTASAY